MSAFYGIIPGILIAFGMGGGSVLIYILNLFESFSQQKIQYINIWLFLTSGLFTIISYGRNKQICIKSIKILIPFSIISCVIFSFISKSMNTSVLKKYFGYFLIILGAWQLFQIIYKYIKNKKVKNK